MLRQPEHEAVQLGALGLVERREEIVLQAAGQPSEPRERTLAVGGHVDDVPSPVGGIALSLDETALLELVEQADELAAVIAEGVRDRPLGLA